MSTRLVPIALVLAALAALSAPSSADVLVADGSVPLQDVVDVAQDGDIVLVKPVVVEFDATVTIAARSLTLVADGGTPILGRLVIRDLPAGGQVTVRGISLDAASPTQGTSLAGGLEVTDCAGSVWIEACSVTPPDQMAGGFGISSPGMAGAFVRQSAAVTFTRCRLEGGDGAPEQPSCVIPGYAPAWPGGDGLRAVGSTVVLHGSELTGGRGGVKGNFSCFFGGDEGGSGLRVEDGTVHAAASTIAGGDMDFSAGDSWKPGPGLTVTTAASLVTVRGTTVSAGAGPPDVLPIDAPPGTFEVYVETPRTLAVSSPLREHEAGQLEIEGLPGDLVAVFMAFQGGAVPVPGKQGFWSLGNPSFGPLLLAVNPTGAWTLPFTASGLVPAALDGQSFLLQLVVRTPAGLVRFEGVTSYALIDAAIR